MLELFFIKTYFELFYCLFLPLICTLACTYQRVRNVSLAENFVSLYYIDDHIQTKLMLISIGHLGSVFTC